MVRKFYFIFLMIFIVNCNLFSGKFYMSKQKEQIANCVLNEACSEISHKYGMSCIGSGGAMMYEIESLKLKFCIKKPLEKDEARKIIVDAADIFLKKIKVKSKFLCKFTSSLAFSQFYLDSGIESFSIRRHKPCSPHGGSARRRL